MNYFTVFYFLSTEVTVIIFVELLVGIAAIISGFGFRHTYVVSLFVITCVLVYYVDQENKALSTLECIFH